MKVITLRKLPQHVARVVEEKSRSEGISFSKAVIRLIEESSASPKPQVTYHDLDALSGKWTRTEADRFDRALSEQRAIDPDLWQ
jgi:hypothetical protein